MQSDSIVPYTIGLSYDGTVQGRDPVMGAAAQGAAIVSVNGDVVCRCEWGTEVAAMAYDLTGDGKGLLRGVHALAGVYVFLRKLYGVCGRLLHEKLCDKWHKALFLGY